MNITLKGNGSVTINSRTFSGKSISIKDGVVTVDGKSEGVCAAAGNPINVEIRGDVEHIDADGGDVTVNGSVGAVRTQSGDVKCGDVGGDAETMSGNITCRNISGNARTMSGNIRGIYLKDR